MAQHRQDVSVVSQDSRQDDEKTIHAERSREFAEKKDIEAARPQSPSAASVKVEDPKTDGEFVEDDFPDGGLRAWTVVLGVGVRILVLCSTA